MGVVGIDQAHQLSYYIAAKQNAAFPSPIEFNSYANLANIDLYNYYNDEREKLLVKVKSGEVIYAPPILANFVVSNHQMNFLGNSASLPNDYIDVISLNKTPASGKINKVDLDELPDYMKSTIDAPTLSNPIYVELPDSFVTYPTLSVAYLTYYQQPATVVWAYTLVNGRPVYDSVNSVDFSWDGTEIYRLVSRILTYMGLSIRDTELTQAAQQMVQGGS